MKRLLQLLLAGVFLLSFTAQARVILPKGGEQWSVGSSVQLEWDASGDTVDIELIRQGQDPIVIDEDVVDTGHYLWEIPATTGSGDDVLVSARNYKIKITQAAKTLISRTFRIMAWDERRLLGPFDEYDRSKVTDPLEAAVLDKNEPITLTWDDYRSFLDRLVSIELRKPGKLKFVARQNKVPNVGSFDWQLTEGHKTDCLSGGCYFVIRSGRKRHQMIASHLFTLDKPVAGDVFTFDEIEGPKAPGDELVIAWTASEGEAEPVRIDLLRASAYYQSITNRTESMGGDKTTHPWTIPATVTGGQDYAVRVTSLEDGTRFGLSGIFTVQSPESVITVNDPNNITLRPGRTSQRLSWKKTTGPVNVDLYRDGRRVKTIVRSLEQGSYLWKVPASLAQSDNYTIRVVQTDDATAYGLSDPFEISLPTVETVAQAPIPARCLDLDLEEDCTAEQAKVKRLERQRACVSHQLYGRDCTKAKLVEAEAEHVRLLARASDRPTVVSVDCPGQILIGDQCRPKSQCPGLHLFDDLRSDVDRTEPEGPRRCDQYLLHSDGTQATAELASVLHYLLTLMHRSNSFQVNWEIAEGFYRDHHGTGGACLSKQAQAFYQSTQSLCESLADGESRPGAYRRKNCRLGERPLCDHWGTDGGHQNNGVGADPSKPQRRYNFLNLPRKSMASGGSWRTQLLELPFHGFLSNRLDEAILHNTLYYKDPDLPKGFYWPDEPVVAPEAFDILDPITRVHAEFIWRTAKFREALYSQSLCGEEFEVLDNYRASDCDDEIVRTHHEVPYDKQGWSYRGEEGWPPVDGEECMTLNAARKYVAVDSTLVECHPLRVPLAGLDKDYLESGNGSIDSRGNAFEGEEQSLYFHDLNLSDHLLFWKPDKFNAVVLFEEAKNAGLVEWKSFSHDAKGLACNAGYGVDRSGSCEICPPGSANEDGLGPCQRCTRHFVATEEGAQSCSLCSIGQVVNKYHNLCMDNPCGESEYWDITTRRCEKDVRQQHKWVQMQFINPGITTKGTNDEWLPFMDVGLYEKQRIQYERALRKLEASVTASDLVVSTDEFVLETAAIAFRHAKNLRYSDDSCFDPELNTSETEDGSSKDCEATWSARRGDDATYRAEELPVARFEYISVKPAESKIDKGSPEIARYYTGLEEILQKAFRRLLRDSMDHHEAAQLRNLRREKAVFALHFSGHGNGFVAADLEMKDIRTIIREELGDNRLGLVTFDMCLMGNYESLLMLEGVTDWVVGHTTPSPTAGWDPEIFLKIPRSASLSTKKYIENLLKGVRNKAQDVGNEGGFYGTAVSFRMDRFALYRQAFDAVLNHLADNMGRHVRHLEELYYPTDYYSEYAHQIAESEKTQHDEEFKRNWVIEHGEQLDDHIHQGSATNTGFNFKFDTEVFLQAFEDSEDQVLRHHAQNALESLRRLADKPESFEVAGVSLEPSPMGFAWSPPMDWFDECKLESMHQRNFLKTRLDDQDELLPGWEPLQALVNFDLAWQESQKKNPAADKEIWKNLIPWAPKNKRGAPRDKCSFWR